MLGVLSWLSGCDGAHADRSDRAPIGDAPHSAVEPTAATGHTGAIGHTGAPEERLFDADHVLVVPDGDGLHLLRRDGVAAWTRPWTELWAGCDLCGGEGASPDGDGLLLSFTTSGPTSGGAIGRIGADGQPEYRRDGFRFPHDAIRDPGDGTIVVPEASGQRVVWVPGDGSSSIEVRALTRQTTGFPGKTPNGSELVTWGDRRYLLLSHRGTGGGPLEPPNGEITMWDVTTPGAETLAWRFPEEGFLDMPHGPILRRHQGRWWMLWAHSGGGEGRRSSVGLAWLDDPARPPTYVADLVPPGEPGPFDFLRGVELTDDGELWLTDSGPGAGTGSAVARGRLFVARMAEVEPTGATGAVGTDQVFVDLEGLALVRGELRNPFEGWLWRPTFPMDAP